MKELVKLADQNLERLAMNPYPGRGIVIGVSPCGKFVVQIYWIMGRSENSRNRIFMAGNGRLHTVPADPSKVKDPSLIIYDAMLESGGVFVVSNGKQTNTCLPPLLEGYTLLEALNGETFEPDAPNFTPRITASYDQDPGIFEIVILKNNFGTRQGSLFSYDEIPNGFGYCVTTYESDGEPLPSFQGEPYIVPIFPLSVILDNYWAVLDETNKVSLAVKWIDRETMSSSIYIANKYCKVP